MTGFAPYPMVEEAQATGAVAGVYAGLLESMPFVPSPFRSRALCPGYLVLAAEPAQGVLSDPASGAAAQELVACVRDAATPPADAEVRQALAGFTGPLGRMLLLAAGLRLALEGELDAPPAPGRTPAARRVEPGSPTPSPADAPAAGLYGDIRAALDTPIVDSVWRSLAGRGLPRQVVASRAALTAAGLDDARPGMAAVLDAYLATLPRVLVLVAPSTDAA